MASRRGLAGIDLVLAPPGPFTTTTLVWNISFAIRHAALVAELLAGANPVVPTPNWYRKYELDGHAPPSPLHPHRRSTLARGALLDMVRASTLSFTVGGCYPLTSSHTEFKVGGRHSMALWGAAGKLARPRGGKAPRVPMVLIVA